MDLREPETMGDACLAEPLAEAERDDPSLACGQSTERPGDRDAILRGAQGVGVVGEPVLVERYDEWRGRRGDLLTAGSCGLRALLVGRRPSQAGHELPVERRKGAAKLVDPSRRAHGLDAVAQVPAELPVDGRDREGEQVVPATGVEAVDCREQRHRADLLQILERLAAAAVAAGERLDEREMQLHEPPAGVRVAVAVGAEAAAALRLDL